MEILNKIQLENFILDNMKDCLLDSLCVDSYIEALEKEIREKDLPLPKSSGEVVYYDFELGRFQSHDGNPHLFEIEIGGLPTKSECEEDYYNDLTEHGTRDEGRL